MFEYISLREELDMDTCQGCPTQNGPRYPRNRDGHAPDCTECPQHCQCDARRRAMFNGPDM